jgi:hypothetical protein
MVKLLQPRESIPLRCEKHIAELSDSVWAQLEKNIWIYFILTSESVAILCTNMAPVDMALNGMDKLGIDINCYTAANTFCLHCKQFNTSKGLDVWSEF